MRNQEYRIKLVGFVSDPEKAKEGSDYIFRLKISGMTDPIWDEKFREACEEDKHDPIPASIGIDKITLECRPAEFEDKYFKRLKEAVESANDQANDEMRRKSIEIEHKAAQKKRQDEDDQKRLVGLSGRIKFD